MTVAKETQAMELEYVQMTLEIIERTAPEVTGPEKLVHVTKMLPVVRQLAESEVVVLEVGEG